MGVQERWGCTTTSTQWHSRYCTIDNSSGGLTAADAAEFSARFPLELHSTFECRTRGFLIRVNGILALHLVSGNAKKKNGGKKEKEGTRTMKQNIELLLGNRDTNFLHPDSTRDSISGVEMVNLECCKLRDRKLHSVRSKKGQVSYFLFFFFTVLQAFFISRPGWQWS